MATSDKFKKTGASTVTTLSAPGKALSATSLTVGSTTNYPTDTGIVIAIRVVDSAGALVAGTYSEWSATVSSATSLAIEAVPVYGTDQVYAAGSTTQVFIPLSSYAHNTLVDGLLSAGLTQAGGMGAISPTSVVSAGVGTFTGDVSDRGTTLTQARVDSQFDYVVSGGVWTADSVGVNLNASMTALVCYINGQRGAISAVTARAFTLNLDTYIDVLNSAGVFTVVYTTATTNAASPALAANSMRIGIIQAAATITATTKVNQGQEDRVFPIASSIPYAVTDSLGNLICPRDPNRRILGYRQQITTQNFTTVVDATALSVPVIVPANRKIRLTMFARSFTSSVANDNIGVGLNESATVLAQSEFSSSTPAGNTNTLGYATGVTSPSTGSHTYKVTLTRTAGTGTCSLFAAATQPACLIVELV